MKDDYATYYANQLKVGTEYQDFIVDLMLKAVRFPVTTYSSRRYQTTVGEGPAGVEIKYDDRYAGTGNLWIEVAEKARPRAGDYVASGVFRPDNSWLYIIGNYDTVFVFAKALLQIFANRFEIRENKSFTSRGFLLPDATARRTAIIVLAPNAQRQVVSQVGNIHKVSRALYAAMMADPRQRRLFERK
jgi:hypothetical protein